MKFQDITQETLLQNPKVRAVSLDFEWYFVYMDMNNEFMGAFGDLEALLLPVLNLNGEREYLKCISYKEIQKRVNTLEGKSDFERHINTALNFNIKKK